MPIVALRRIEVFASAVRILGFVGACTASVGRALSRDGSKIVSLRFRAKNECVSLRIASSDWEVFKQVYLQQDYSAPSPQHDAALDRLYQTMIADGRTPCVIDCGANIGLASLWYSSRYPQAGIIALEPEPSNFYVLQRNVKARPNIVALNAAISNIDGKVDLLNKTGASWSWRTVKSEAGSTPTRTIDQLLAEMPDSAPLIVKIDIEGFETELMRSNTDWIERVPLIVFESHDRQLPWSGSAHSFFAALSKSERDYLQHDENTFSYSKVLLRAFTEVDGDPPK